MVTNMKTNCPNCGAPIDYEKNKCEYCGTPYIIKDIECEYLFCDEEPILKVPRNLEIIKELESSGYLTYNEKRKLLGLPEVKTAEPIISER